MEHRRLRISVTSDNITHNKLAIKFPDTLDELQEIVKEKFNIIDPIFKIGDYIIDTLDIIRDDELISICSRENSHLHTPPNDITLDTWIKLNVGGKVIWSSRATLTKEPDSMLTLLLNDHKWKSLQDETGAILIDRSPTYFEPILDFLRHGKIILNPNTNPEGVLEEAEFFGINSAIEPLTALVNEYNQIKVGPFTRKEFIKILLQTPFTDMLRCQGVNLTGCDLSKLDLRNINFKFAIMNKCNLSYSNLSNCIFDQADLNGAILDHADLRGVKMRRAQMVNVSALACIMDDSGGVCAILEGSNMKGAVFDEAQLAGANIRLVNLKGGSLNNCNLRNANLAGTNLEDADLSNANLQLANLRGTNLENCTMENVTPIHMSQTMNSQ